MVFETFRVKKIIWSSLNTTYPVNNQLIFQGDLIKTINRQDLFKFMES